MFVKFGGKYEHLAAGTNLIYPNSEVESAQIDLFYLFTERSERSSTFFASAMASILSEREKVSQPRKNTTP